MFKAAYDSAWHHPGIAWFAALTLILLVVSRLFGERPFPLRGYFVVFAIEIALDAYFSGPYAPKALATLPAWSTALSVAFVILGDYRYFVLLEGFSRGAFDRSAFGKLGGWLRAVPYALIVPVASTIVREVYPAPFVDERKTYLLYEVMFFTLALVLRFVVLPKRFSATSRLDASRNEAAISSSESWLYLLTGFEIVQYGLWALADVILLAGHVEPGYLLRLVPNVLYYGVFLLFAWRTLPTRDTHADRVGARGAAPV